MAKVSVLMNCYNGEKYIREAINSVFAQSFEDWEIVFVDNCSVDKSAEIAKSYGGKIKYYKTDTNVSLGEARAFGIEQCKGKYLMYLDVDDKYHQNTIQFLLDEILETDFTVVYAGNNIIDDAGKMIGKFLPSKKSGYIFSELMMNFDIPTASLIVDLALLRESNITYDPNIIASAEYALYLQLSVKNKFKCLSDAIFDYRIHSSSLTSEKQTVLYADRVYTLEKIIKDHKKEKIDEIYSREFREGFARANYYKARNYFLVNKTAEARKILKKSRFLSINYFVVYALTFMPMSLRDYVFKIKYSR